MGLIGALAGRKEDNYGQQQYAPKFDTGYYHSHQEILDGLNKLDPTESGAVAKILQKNGVWGNAASSLIVYELVRDNLGDELAQKVQDMVLTRMVPVGISPEQKARNIRLTRFKRNRQELAARAKGRNQHERHEVADLTKRQVVHKPTNHGMAQHLPPTI